MTDDERRQAYSDGQTSRDVRECGQGEGGFSIEYWRERRRGAEASLAALGAHYVYGEGGESSAEDEAGGYFYGEAS